MAHKATHELTRHLEARRQEVLRSSGAVSLPNWPIYKGPPLIYDELILGFTEEYSYGDDTE